MKPGEASQIEQRVKTSVFLMNSGLKLAVSGRANGQVIQAKTDWLIGPTPYRAVVTSNATKLFLENGLARRAIRLAPFCFTKISGRFR